MGEKAFTVYKCRWVALFFYAMMPCVMQMLWITFAPITGEAAEIYRYSAEICYPAPEATSQGLLMLAGQISGIIYILGMDAFRSADGSMTPFLLFMIAIIPINIFLAMRLKESTMVEAGSGR